MDKKKNSFDKLKKGSFTKQAKRAGLSVNRFTDKVLKNKDEALQKIGLKLCCPNFSYFTLFIITISIYFYDIIFNIIKRYLLD